MTREMQNTNIEWIGKIPSTWEIIPLKYATININESNNPIKMTNILSLTNTQGVLPYEEKGSKGNISKDDLTQYKLAYKGTIVINSMNLKIGSVGLSDYDGCVSPVYYVLKNNDRTDINYINYLFKSEFQKYLGKFGKGILEIREKISMYDVMRSHIPLPSLEIQKGIVRYLDKKCSIIDDQIENNKKVIDLMDEYKQNIIDNNCLKNNENTKKTNHYSIDEIPESWDFNKILSVLEIPITDGPHETPLLIEDGIPFISADAIKNGKIDFDRKRGYISIELYREYSKKYTPKLNDIYMIKSGATTGKIAMVETTDIFTIWSPLAVFRCDEKKMIPKYLYYLLSTNFFQNQVQLNWSFGTQQNIGMRVLEQLKIVVPSVEEQIKIVAKLDEKCSKIDIVIDYRKQIIEKLEEYRKSLIYEAVTGKVEV